MLRRHTPLCNAERGKRMINSQYFKSIIDQDRTAVVICNLAHEIIYMNPAAIRQNKADGSEAFIGKSLMDCHTPKAREMIAKVVEWFKADSSHNRIYTFHNVKYNRDVYMIALREEDGTLIGYYEKHEYRTQEQGKRYDFSASESI